MVAFQRAAMLAELLFGHPPALRFPLADPGRVRRARDLILQGLDEAERTRAAYQAEHDDDREWVPDPSQR